MESKSHQCLQRALFYCFLSSTVESASYGAFGESRNTLKAAGKRNMAQLCCKDRDFAVLHAAINRENGFLLKKRKRLGELDAVGH